MSYIDSIDDNIKEVESRIKELHKVKKNLKKEKQRYCPHHNLVRYTNMPRLSYTSAVVHNGYTTIDTLKVKTKCKDCGKVLD